MDDFINLEKDDEFDIDLDKGIDQIEIGLSWDENPNASEDDAEFDGDLVVAVLDNNGKLIRTETAGQGKWLVFFNNLRTPNDEIVSVKGDNRSGRGEGDDEAVMIKPNALPPQAVRIDIIAIIHQGVERGQTWGLLNARLNIRDVSTKKITHQFKLASDHTNHTTIEAARLVRKGGNKWSLVTVDTGHNQPLKAFAGPGGVWR